jgi:hypothetical protein
MATKSVEVVEVIDGCIHFDGKVYVKGDVFNIDEKFAKDLIESKVAREVQKEVEITPADQEKDSQDGVFEKIGEDLTGKNKGKK